MSTGDLRIFKLASFVFVGALTSNAQSHQVGYRDIDFKVSDTRSVHGRIWYPIDGKLAEAPIVTPSFLEKFYGVKDAPFAPDTSLPLLLISHGSGAKVERLDWVADAMARKGWIVAGFNHPHNSFDDNTAMGLVRVWDRAKDTKKFLSYLMEKDPAAAFVNQRKIFALGHSAGGAEVLLLAGARFSKKNFSNPLPMCEPATDPDLDDERCGELKRIDFSTLLPAEVEGDYADHRIAGVISLDPGFAHSFDKKRKLTHRTLIIVADKLKHPSGELYSKDFKSIFPKSTLFSPQGSIHISFVSPCNEVGIKEKIPLCTGDENRKEIQRAVLDKIQDFVSR